MADPPEIPEFPNYGTTIIYGGVEIVNVSTESIKQTAYMDSTSADQVGVQVEMTVTGILHKWSFDKTTTPINLGAYVGDLDGSKAGENIEKFRTTLEKLNAPMRRFVYRINDTVVWDVAPIVSDSEVDVFGFEPEGDGKRAWDEDTHRPAMMNTPKATCTVLRVISDSACWVRFEIEFIYNPCDKYGPPLTDDGFSKEPPISDDYDQIASLRWWCADDINVESWLTTRAWSGVIQLKSRKISPHILRYLVFPPLPRYGWKRAGIKFSESEDGLSLKFEIVDEEVIACPPFPSSAWKGNVVINAPFAGAGLKTIDISLELQAPKEIRKDHLAFLMLRVMDTKIQWYNFASRGTMFCQGIRISEVIGQNIVSGDLSVSVVLAGDSQSGSNGGADEAYQEVIAFPELITKVFGNDMTDALRRVEGELPEPLYPVNVPNTYIENYHAKEPAYWLPSSASLASIVIPQIQTPCKNTETIPAPKDGIVYVARKPIVDGTERSEDQTTGYKSKDVYPSDDSFGAGLNGNKKTPPVTTTEQAKVKTMARSPYLIYKLASRYITDKGISSFPLYGTNRSSDSFPEVIVARLRKPITKRVFRFEASRINRWPMTPTDRSWRDPETGIVHICEHVEIEAQNVEASADGRKYRYTVTGTLRYVLSRTPTAGEKLFVGSVPHITGALEEDDIINNSVVYMDNERRDAGQFKPDGVGYTEPPPSPPPPPPPPPPPGPLPGLPVP